MIDRGHSHILWSGLLLLCFISGCATVGQDVHGVHNFDQVQPQVLYRGAQPDLDGLATLKAEYHVATIINLRESGPDWEAAAAKAAGLTYHSISSSAFAVDPEKIRQVLHILRTAPGPIFIHCRQGRDRTGLAVAVYRIVDQHWTREAALAELYAHGQNRLIFWAIAHFLKNFNPADFASPPAKPVEAALNGPN
jgi:protein tyrosine/serine phosphatase